MMAQKDSLEELYPELKVLYSDFVRENGQPKPMDDDPNYPYRLEVITSLSGLVPFDQVELYGPTPKKIFGSKTLEALEAYITSEKLERKPLISFRLTDPQGKVLKQYQ